MLTELYIRDFAIIDELRLQLVDGFNVLTGETGAGKSIILDAMSLVMGGRADTTMLRAGAEVAQIEANFTLSPPLQALLLPLLEREGLESEDPALLLLARELRAGGRTVCRVNGRTVTLALLRDVADGLVDIHGQGEHLSLLRPRAHLPLLDAYGGLVSQREALGREVRQLQQLQLELAGLRRDERVRAQRQDFLTFRLQEINAANLQDGEEEELISERKRLGNSEQLLRDANEVRNLLLGQEDDSPNVIDLLGQAERALGHLARLDDAQMPLLSRMQGLTSEINDAAADVEAYLESLEFNPGRLDYLEQRLEVINRLKRKYGATVAEVLASRDEAVVELEKITGSEARIGELAQIEGRFQLKIGKLAAALSARRQEVAAKLAAAVVTELTDLGMDGSRFSVDFQRRPDDTGVPVDGTRYACDASGIDQAEFLISANPGEPLKPMARVASGGETARLMLALKTALARVDETPTLIFDEIDQGIGGRIGAVVGEKLWRLTTGGLHQVIVITHLPQLAGFGDVHFHVSKHLNEGRTTTRVQALEEARRLAELSAMLGTGADHGQKGAEAILSSAALQKQKGDAG